MRKGLIEYCVMKVLSAGEGYGYQIVQELKLVDQLAITESIVYPILSRLRNDGYLSVRVHVSPDGPPRRYYRLTALGEQRLQDMTNYWNALCKGVRHLGEKEKTTNEQ